MRGLLAGGIAVMLSLLAGAEPAAAQKYGGVLRMPHGDSPASMSIHEESTIVAEGPMMAVFNNLMLFDQHIAQNSFDRSCRNWRRAGPGTRPDDADRQTARGRQMA